MKVPSSPILTPGSRLTRLPTIPFALLVLLGTLAFGTACYPSAARLPPMEPGHPSQHESATPFHAEAPVGNRALDTSEKFLAYLPHSGFHNQRIALENAMVLSSMLNRTLIVPPIRLGKSPIKYSKFDKLSRFASLAGNEGLKHCVSAQSSFFEPLECHQYLDHVHLAWDWLVNTSSWRTDVTFVQRQTMNPLWFQQHLQIRDEDVYYLRDKDPYDFRFFDQNSATSDADGKYHQSVQISCLSNVTARLLYLGTLFGSSRLRLKDTANIRLRGRIRRAMTYANPQLHSISDAISAQMGGTYLAAHIRISDGTFRARRWNNSRILWWKLVKEVLQLNTAELLAAERVLVGDNRNETYLDPPYMPEDRAASRIPIPSRGLPFESPFRRISCRSPLHTSRQFQRLNMPVFVSTDAPVPWTDPVIALFLKTFPCTFFLSDFSRELGVLDVAHSEGDGVLFKHFLFPFLDAMVAAKAWRVFGTEGSTFSTFVQDVLWRSYLGWQIVERG